MSSEVSIPATAPAARLPATPTLARRSWWRIVFSFPNVLTVIYTVLVGALLMRHALWRDEAQAFLIARDSRSLGELFWNLRYEGHPPLWHILLWIITRFTQHPEAMQALHLAMAAGTVWLVARHAPYPLVAKILFPFGYFMVFEYAVISRNYQIMLLLLVGLCVVWQKRGMRLRFIWLGVLLGLLSLSHVLGIILGAGFGVMLLAETAYSWMGARTFRRHWIQFAMGLVIAGAATAWSVHLLVPPPDYSFAIGWATDFKDEHNRVTLYTLWNGLVPIMRPGIDFWSDSNILLTPNVDPYAALAPAAKWAPWVALGCLLMVIRSWRAVLFLTVAGTGSLLFAHLKMVNLYGLAGGTRHHGIYYIAVLGACWLAWSGTTARPRKWTRWLTWLPPRLAFVVLLGAHVYGAWAPVQACWKYPFSMSRQAADILRPKLGPHDILTGPIDYLITPVVAYLPGHDVFLADEGKWRSFAYWEKIPPGANRSVTYWAEKIARDKQLPVVMILYGQLDPSTIKRLNAESLGQASEPCIQGDERYYMYRVDPKKIPATVPAPASSSGFSLRDLFK